MTIWNYPTRVRFGAGEAREVGREVRALGADRVLIVSDAGVQQAGLLAPIAVALSDAGIGVETFAAVSPNPTEDDVQRGVAQFVSARATAIVAVGGGSPIDAAKLIAVRVATALPFEELDDAIGGDRHIPAALTSIVALPTTAGTGSEVGRSGVVTLASTGRKTVIFSPALMPKVAILDPELTVGLPALATAATGFDALTHCIEAFVAKGDHPMADAVALGGIELVRGALREAVHDPMNLRARGDMLKAAMMGAVAFQKGLGACHSMAHPLSSEHGVHHGLANALCLPVVVRLNEPSAAAKYRRVADLLGGTGLALAEVLEQLRVELGLPGSLAQAGIPRTSLPRLAHLANLDACHGGNPVACDEGTFLELFDRAFA